MTRHQRRLSCVQVQHHWLRQHTEIHVVLPKQIAHRNTLSRCDKTLNGVIALTTDFGVFKSAVIRKKVAWPGRAQELPPGRDAILYRRFSP